MRYVEYGKYRYIEYKGVSNNRRYVEYKYGISVNWSQVKNGHYQRQRLVKH